MTHEIKDNSLSTRTWRNPLMGWVLIVGALLILGDLWYSIPPPGVASLILSIVAGIAAFRGEIKGREKYLWAVIFILFARVEFKAIKNDREATAREVSAARDEQNKKFDAIAKGVEKSLTGITEVWSQETGGDSFIYLNVSDFADNPIDLRGNIITNAIPTFVGRYPLHNVFIDGSSGMTRWRDEVNYGTYAPHENGKLRRGFELSFPPSESEIRYDFFINTSNGSYSQDILCLKVGTKWQWASHVGKYGRKGYLKVMKSAGFPKDRLNQKSWYK